MVPGSAGRFSGLVAKSPSLNYMARTQRTIRWLSRILCARDRERQVTGNFTGVQADAAWALMLLTSQARQQLSSSQCAGLALLIHHGGSVHDLRVTKHVLARQISTPEHILLYRQITDRIQIMHGRPQIYGTQWKVDKATGETKLFPMRTDVAVKKRGYANDARFHGERDKLM